MLKLKLLVFWIIAVGTCGLPLRHVHAQNHSEGSHFSGDLDLLADQIAAAYFEDELLGPRASAASTTSTLESMPVFDQLFSDRSGSLRSHRGLIQFGYSYTRDEEDGVLIEDVVLPDMLLRYRFTDRLEMRLAWGGWLRSKITDQWLGFEESDVETLDPTVGLKLLLWQQRQAIPSVSVLASVPIATRGNPFATRSLLPAVDVFYAWQLSERWSFAGSSGLILRDREDETQRSFSQSLSVNHLWTESFAVYADASLLASEDRQEWVGTTGFQWLATERIQVSPFAGLGLSKDAPDLQVGVGLGWSF